jgi:AraC-like DNA-binding protein
VSGFGQRPGMTLADLRLYLAAGGPSDRSAALLAAHGVDVDAAEGTVVPIDACWRIFSEHAALTGDELHCVFGFPLRPGGTNLIIARMLLCRTLHEALVAYAEAAAIVAPDVAVTVTRRREGLSLKWRPPQPENPLHQIVLEGTASVYFAVFTWLTDREPPVLRVRAPAPRAASGSTLLHAIGAPVIHGGEEVELVFAPQAGLLPVRQDDIAAWRDGAYKVLSAMALRPLADRPGGAFADKVRSALLDERVDQEGVARRWGVSAKTVARRLELEGASFRRLRDEMRMHKSRGLIHAGLTVEEIGDQLGYEDPRSFRRAFRRWFGVSPTAYRSQRHVA